VEGFAGRLEDLVVRDENWAIRYIIVDTGGWFPGRKVQFAPQWVGKVSGAERKVQVALAQETIKNCPEFDPATLAEQT
jgi:hypothetical protein